MKNQVIIPPENGWENKSYYVVEVASNIGDFVHVSILSVGFTGNTPFELGAYCYIFNLAYEDEIAYPEEFRYIKALRKIDITSGLSGKILTKEMLEGISNGN